MGPALTDRQEANKTNEINFTLSEAGSVPTVKFIGTSFWLGERCPIGCILGTSRGAYGHVVGDVKDTSSKLISSGPPIAAHRFDEINFICRGRGIRRGLFMPGSLAVRAEPLASSGDEPAASYRRGSDGNINRAASGVDLPLGHRNRLDRFRSKCDLCQPRRNDRVGPKAEWQLWSKREWEAAVHTACPFRRYLTQSGHLRPSGRVGAASSLSLVILDAAVERIGGPNLPRSGNR